MLKLDARRLRRWRRRRSEGRLDDAAAGGAAAHAITPAEREAVLEMFDRFGESDRGYRKLAHRGSYENLVWVSPSTLYRVLAGEGLVLPARPRPASAPARPMPQWVRWQRHQIWIYDITCFAAANRVAYAVMDVVTRKWLATVVSAEETATQVEVLFSEALDAEGLWPAVEARHKDNSGTDGNGGDGGEPILLAMSDNGPQMRAGTTREFLALCSIAARYGRPGTPPPTKPGSRPCSDTSKPNGPTSTRSATQPSCEQSSTSPAPTTTAAACTPRSATSPPTTNTTAAATPSAKPDNTASPEPDKPASPTIATTNPTSHNHPPPMRRNQHAQSGHLLRSTSPACLGCHAPCGT